MSAHVSNQNQIRGSLPLLLPGSWALGVSFSLSSSVQASSFTSAILPGPPFSWVTAVSPLLPNHKVLSAEALSYLRDPLGALWCPYVVPSPPGAQDVGVAVLGPDAYALHISILF